MAGQEGWAGLFAGAFKDSRNAMVLLDDQRRHVDVNGAYLAQLGYSRERLIGAPVYEFVVGGPISDKEWNAAISRGGFTGEGELLAADGRTVGVQYAAHTEVVTGRRLVLFVALSTSRWGRHFRRDVDATATAEPLSRREREIVRLIAGGASGPEIAGQLHISHDTVRTHVRNAMTKLGARSRAQLVAKSLGEGHILG
jgi:PAS domain S-box-containing protein